MCVGQRGWQHGARREELRANTCGGGTDGVPELELTQVTGGGTFERTR